MSILAWILIISCILMIIGIILMVRDAFKFKNSREEWKDNLDKK